MLQKLPNARGVLVTAGGSGAAYCFRSLDGGADDVGHVPVYSVNVQDTTGAGDAFTCGFLSYLLAEVRSCACTVCLRVARRSPSLWRALRRRDRVPLAEYYQCRHRLTRFQFYCSVDD